MFLLIWLTGTNLTAIAHHPGIIILISKEFSHSPCGCSTICVVQPAGGPCVTMWYAASATRPGTSYSNSRKHQTADMVG